MIVDQFVREVSYYLGLAGGVGLREYGRAIELTFEALELKKGDKVVISPLVPAEYKHAMEKVGIVPLYADVERDSGCLSARTVEPLLEQNPSAIVIHYPLGLIPDVDGLTALDIPLIEDISTAFGGNTGEKKCGRHGRYVILGLEADGIITVGGGAVILAGSRNDVAILKTALAAVGRTASMQDMNGALGLVQMKSLERFILARREIAGYYERSLLKTRHKSLTQDGESENVYYTFPVLLAGGMRDIQQYARKKQVITAPAFEHAVIAANGIANVCPNANALYLRCVVFPLYPSLKKQDAEHIAKVIASLP